MAKAKPKVDVEAVRKDCFGYRCDDRGNLSCTALEELYCGVEGEGPCQFFKPKNRVPMRGQGVSCKFCGKPFLPRKYSNGQTKYCSQECREKARYVKNKILPGGRFRDKEEVDVDAALSYRPGE